MRQFDILRVVYSICRIYVFHGRGFGIYEYLYGRGPGIWALPVFYIWEKYTDVSHVCNSAGAFSVLSAAVFAGQGKEHVLHVYTNNRPAVYNTKLYLLPYWTAEV